MMKKFAVNGTVGLMRVASDVGSIIVMIAFAYATVKLKDLAIAHYVAAGDLPNPSFALLAAIFSNPEIVYPWWNFVATWFCAIAAGGAAWMTLLGIRSSWIILMRRISKLA